MFNTNLQDEEITKSIKFNLNKASLFFYELDKEEEYIIKKPISGLFQFSIGFQTSPLANPTNDFKVLKFKIDSTAKVKVLLAVSKFITDGLK